MRISCQTRHIICFVINLIIYLIINRNIYIYIYIYICVCAMSSSAPENQKKWRANGYTNRRFVWKRREAPIVFYSSGVNSATAHGEPRAKRGPAFSFFVVWSEFVESDFLPTCSGAWQLVELLRVCVCFVVRVCVAFCGDRGIERVCVSVCVCVCVCVCVLHFVGL